MPNISSLMMAIYEDDLGRSYTNVGFKIKEEYAQLGISQFGYEERKKQICGVTGSLFKLRAAEATFVFDGKPQRIRFPIPTITDIGPIINKLVKNSNAVCVDLVGEQWSVLPPTGLYNPGNPTFTLGQSGDKDSGTFQYNSDLLGSIRAKYAVELEPKDLSGAILSNTCMPDRKSNVACTVSTVGFKPRRLIAIANNKNGGVIRRNAYVTATKNPIKECASSLGSQVACLGYQGESIRNAHLYIGDESA